MIKRVLWTADETILSLELLLRSTTPPAKMGSDVVALSELLRAMRPDLTAENPKYRNPDGVYMKLMNLRAHDPSLDVKGLPHGAELEKLMWDEYGTDRKRLTATAHRIRDAVSAGSQAARQTPGLVDDPFVEEATEGRLLTSIHRRRERSRKLVEKAKAARLSATGKLECEGCGFDFKATYGEHGDGFIEAHHKVPLHEAEVTGSKTKLSDLALLCANCHRMVHRRRPWLTMEQLVQMATNRRAPPGGR